MAKLPPPLNPPFHVAAPPALNATAVRLSDHENKGVLVNSFSQPCCPVLSELVIAGARIDVLIWFSFVSVRGTFALKDNNNSSYNIAVAAPRVFGVSSKLAAGREKPSDVLLSTWLQTNGIPVVAGSRS